MHVSFKAIGRNIRAARTELGITQEDAAERLKISQLHFGRLERGERPASLEMLAKIAGVFGVSLTSLLNGCLIGEGFEQRPSAGPESLGQRIASIANGCSPKAQRLMLELCRDVALSDNSRITKKFRRNNLFPLSIVKRRKGEFLCVPTFYCKVGRLFKPIFLLIRKRKKSFQRSMRNIGRFYCL